MLNITRETITFEKISNNRADYSFKPAVGSNVGVVYIEPAPGQGGAILAKLAEIEALCVGYGKEIWLASSYDGGLPQIDIRVIVQDNTGA